MVTPKARRSRMRRQVLNAAMLALVLWANAMAGAGTISGESIGLIANRHASYFLPADYVFGIWGLIYLSLIVFVVYQALPARRASPTMDRIGWAWMVSGLLNVAWVVAFSFSRFGAALLIMVGLLASLVWIHERIGVDRVDLGRGDRLFIAYPFTLYLAWICVALIANTAQLLTYLEWDGLGISGPMWSAIMMAVTATLAAFVVFLRGSWIFPFVMWWAFIGIANRFGDILLIVSTAYAATVLGFVAMVLGLAWRRRVRQQRHSANV
jgi:hypothetical protein